MRLLNAMEDEAAHRRQVENTIIKRGFRSNTTNTFIGFGALVALGVLSYLFMINGYARSHNWHYTLRS
jgi:hypothetical protein